MITARSGQDLDYTAICLSSLFRGEVTDEADCGAMILAEVLLLVGKTLAGDNWNKGGRG